MNQTVVSLHAPVERVCAALGLWWAACADVTTIAERERTHAIAQACRVAAAAFDFQEHHCVHIFTVLSGFVLAQRRAVKRMRLTHSAARVERIEHYDAALLVYACGYVTAAVLEDKHLASWNINEWARVACADSRHLGRAVSYVCRRIDFCVMSGVGATAATRLLRARDVLFECARRRTADVERGRPLVPETPLDTRAIKRHLERAWTAAEAKRTRVQ